MKKQSLKRYFARLSWSFDKWGLFGDLSSILMAKDSLLARHFKTKTHLAKRESKRMGTTFVSPRTLGNLYDYQSQHLTFIPANISTSHLKKSFQKFDELAKTTKSMHQSMLGSIVMEDVSIRNQEEKKAR